MISEPGVYNVSFDDYLADPVCEPSLSRSMIPLLLDAPIKAWWSHPKLNPDYKKKTKDESKFDPGSACHDLLFEGGKNTFEITGFNDWKKDAAKEAREAARSIGKIPLLTKQFDIASAMAEAARTQIRECEELGINNLISEGDMELTYVWQEKNEIWCRIRPDWTRKDKKLMIDYKTSGTNINPDEFGAHMGRMNYPIQSVFYRRGVKAIDKTDADFVFVAQEDEPPYLCSFHGIDIMAEEMAGQKVEWAIKKWHECLTTGRWAGYPKRICYQEPKPWDLAEWQVKKSYMEAL